METYRSGRNETDSKSVEPFWFRGFESHRLRFSSLVFTGLFFVFPPLCPFKEQLHMLNGGGIPPAGIWNHSCLER